MPGRRRPPREGREPRPPAPISLDIGHVLSRAFSITWRHRWLWLLGVFGGGGLGARLNFPTAMPGSRPGRRGGNGGTAALSHFVTDHAALIVAVALLVLVLVVVGTGIACVAVPASIWAGLQLDAGRQVGLRAAWREGRRRGWRYFRLGLLKFLLSGSVLLVAALFGGLGALLYASGGTAVVPILVLAGLATFLGVILALLFIGLALAWSDQLLVILGVSARDSIRASWWLFRHNKTNTVLFGLAVGLARFGISLGVALAAGVVAAPGIVMVVVYFTAGASSLLAVVGVAWTILLGGGVLLVGGGYTGALVQVAYALAARDLSLRAGLQVLPEVAGMAPS